MEEDIALVERKSCQAAETKSQQNSEDGYLGRLWLNLRSFLTTRRNVIGKSILFVLNDTKRYINRPSKTH